MHEYIFCLLPFTSPLHFPLPPLLSVTSLTPTPTPSTPPPPVFLQKREGLLWLSASCKVAVSLGTSSPNKAGQGNQVGGKGSKADIRIRDSPCSQWSESQKKIKLHNCNTNAEGL